MILKFTLIIASTLFLSTSFSQYEKSLASEGILPFTGAKFATHGLSGEEFELRLAGDTWTSNKLPINTKFEIKLKKPTGLILGSDEKIHPGVEVLILTNGKDTLGHIPNIFGDNSEEGFDPETLKSLTLSLQFNEMTKVGDSCLVFVNFFDTKGPNHLNVELLLIIADPNLPLDVTNSTSSYKNTEGLFGISSNMSSGSMEVTKDAKTSTIKMQIIEIEEMSLYDLISGTFEVSQYDNNKKIKIAKKAKVEFKQDELPKILVTIPANEANIKYVRFRWESKDKSKIIDLIGEI